MRNPPRILVVDDNPTNLEVLRVRLNSQGYEVVTAVDGEDALVRARELDPDLVLLDVMMPKLDGISVLKELKRDATLRFIPVILVTAKADTRDIVNGLEAGGDDYLTKPFRVEELLARVRALIRRSRGHAAPELRCGALSLDTRQARVTVDGAAVRLTSQEFRVLSYLMHHRGRVVPQSELAEHIYTRQTDRDSNTVEVFIARLRRKLGAERITTVRGLGYRMDDV